MMLLVANKITFYSKILIKINSEVNIKHILIKIYSRYESISP